MVAAKKQRIRLMPIEDVKGAEYNPRIRIPERFDKLVNSLHHLGFVIPLYINQEGTLLSGHQRTAAAKELGYTHVPVVDISVTTTEEKGINIFFNRATNDFEGIETSKDVFAKFTELEEVIDFTTLREIAPNTEFPCMSTTVVPIDTLFSGIAAPSATSVLSARTLLKKGVSMPIVVCGNKVLNGSPRVYAYKHAGATELEVVNIPEDMAAYAQWVLNGLSMDFNLQEAFAEELRFNAFRRLSVQMQMVGFSRTYSFFPFGRTVGATKGSALRAEGVSPDLSLLPHLDATVKRKYRDTYGDTVIDFGCGTGHDAALLSKGGFNVLSFEPYRYPEGGKVICPETSRTKNREFLGHLKELFNAETPRSIISSYVLNSIPHHSDRMAYLAIVAAMCSPSTTAFIGTQHVSVRAGSMRDKITANMEPNMTIGDTVSSFKVQKYFHVAELESMLKVFWVRVAVTEKENTIYARCHYRKLPSKSLLSEALELEFDLPYADGSRMGLVSLAKEIFGKYHGLSL